MQNLLSLKSYRVSFELLVAVADELSKGAHSMQNDQRSEAAAAAYGACYFPEIATSRTDSNWGLIKLYDSPPIFLMTSSTTSSSSL